MKIEKVNDHQIRCTLTKADLADRELKISELAYGTEKAKSLFRDMMQQASFEFGFEAEDIPLMIEAIPLNSECIVLVITKVEDPEELDTRFSKFAPSVQDDENEFTESSGDALEQIAKGADDVLDLFKKLHDSKYTADAGNRGKEAASDSYQAGQTGRGNVEGVNLSQTDASANLTKIYSFDSLGTLIRLAHVLNHYFDGINSLYKDEIASSYKLVISKSGHTPEEFNKICNILTEYSRPETYSHAGEAFLKEHFSLIIENNAIQSFATL